MKRYKVLFCDLDGTLITKNKNDQSAAPWNMQINIKLLEKIRQMRPDYIFIVTNQGSVGKTITEKEFEAKLDFLGICITYYMRQESLFPVVESIYCTSDDAGDFYRKPNPGMMQALVDGFGLKDEYEATDMIMVGDSSGLDRTHGDVDYRMAKNFGICYCDVNEFLKINKFE